MTTARKRVAEAALKIIAANPTGIRWADLHRAVRAALPDENPNTVNGSLHHFRNHLPAGVSRPDRGVYAIGDGAAQEPAQVALPTVFRHRETDFYQPFADFLVGDLEEATRAEPIGGNGAGGKWGTPDVIGLYEARPSDPIKFTTEVVAAEIKIDTQSLIVAFGQACAYKLFADRVYIVVPRNSNPNDLKRLDALASVVGIGLVKFNADDPDNPEFQVMVRAAKHEPDYFYTNEVLSNFKREFGL
ncbi:hypothetical protein ACI2IY_20685 [Lysobacter enzymogenes]|uniref:hypothetical protein n=1 Tax=Lysobacter enzymogenes TaxID=69 RepID=UPI00384DEE87